MNVASVLFSECTCDLTCNIPKRTSKSSVFQRCLSAKQERCLRRYEPLRHAKRHCLPALAAFRTGTSPAGRIKEEKEIAEALVQADLPYTTHSWQWKGHKVNYAVRIPPPIKFPPCSYQSLSYPNLFVLCFCLSFLITPCSRTARRVHVKPHVAFRNTQLKFTIQVGRDVVAQVAGCGPPVVLVHGFGASIGHFRKNIPALAKHYKVRGTQLHSKNHTPGFIPTI